MGPCWLLFLSSSLSSPARRLAILPIGPFCDICSPAARDNFPLNGVVQLVHDELLAFSVDYLALTAGDARGEGRSVLPRARPALAPKRLGSRVAYVYSRRRFWEQSLERLSASADELEQSLRIWATSQDLSLRSDDFQSRELTLVFLAQLERAGLPVHVLLQSLQLLVDDARAICAARERPPAAPADSLNCVRALSLLIEGLPEVGEPVFVDARAGELGSALVEGHELAQRHAALLTLGAQYGTLDARSKCLFVAQLMRLELQWERWYARLDAAAALNPAYEVRVEAWLKERGLGSGGLRTLLDAVHAFMRAEACADPSGSVELTGMLL